MSKPEPVKSVVAEAPPAVKPVVSATASAQAVAKLELLDGGEVIQLTIKPSLWFIALVSMRWVLSMALIAVAIAFALTGGWTLQGQIVFQLACAIAATRIGIGMLQWASRLYVLTNRRVLRFSGVFNVQVTGCPLAKIGAADLQVEPYQRWLRLGSIRICPARPAEAPDSGPACPATPTTIDSGLAGRPSAVVWEHVANPTAVHDIVVKAIRKSQQGERRD